MEIRKTALVTGVSSGIGKEFAKILAKDRYNLVLVDKDREKCEILRDSLETEHNIDVILFIEDLSNDNTPYKIYHTLMADKVDIDILINNAGIGAFGRFSETDWRHEVDILKVNISVLTHFTKLF